MTFSVWCRRRVSRRSSSTANETPRRAEIESMAAVPNIQIERLPKGKLSLHEGRSQPADSTLYLKGKRWSVGWNGDFIEVLLRQRRRSCGIAGSVGSR